MNESVISTFTGVKFIQGLTPMTQENWQSYFGSAIKNGVYSGLAPKNAPQSTVSIQVTDGVVFANGIQARLETEDGYTDIGSMLNTGLEDRLICVRVHYNSETAELIQKSNVTDIPSSAVERTKNYLFAQTLAKLTADESYLCTRNESYWDVPIFYQSKYNSWVMYGRDLRRKVELSPSKLTNPPLDTTDRTWQYGVLISGQNRYTAGDSSQNIIFFPDVVNVADGAIITISAPRSSDFDFILSQVPYTGSWIYTDNPNGTTPGYNQGIRTIYTYSNGSGVWTENVVITGSGTDNVILGTKRTIPANTSKSFRINFGGITVGDNGYINPQFTIEEFDNIAAVNWGRIGGNITAQTDLGDALALKANASDVYNNTETYSKTEVDDALAVKADSSDVYDKTETYSKAETYNKTEVDNKLAVKANVSDVYNKTEVDNKIEDAIADAVGSLDVYSKSEVDNKLAVKANAADVYSKTETDNKLTEKANVSDVYTKTEVDNKIITYHQLELYVIESIGDDSNDGSHDHPFRTLTRAIDAIPFGGHAKIIAVGSFSENIDIPAGKSISMASYLYSSYDNNIIIIGNVTIEGNLYLGAGGGDILLQSRGVAPTLRIRNGGLCNISTAYTGDLATATIVNNGRPTSSDVLNYWAIRVENGGSLNFCYCEGQIRGYNGILAQYGASVTYGNEMSIVAENLSTKSVNSWINGVYR